MFIGKDFPLWLILVYAMLFLPYGFLVNATKKGTWSWKEILFLGFSIRVACAFLDPILSDDIFRYVWEGRVNLEGLSPFANAPNAENLVYLRDKEIWPAINHNQIPAIYPPFAQFFFTVIALFKGGTLAMKLGFIAFEGLSIAMLFGVLKKFWTQNRMTLALAIYFLNPLVIYEVAWSGHLDVLGWFPLTIALTILSYRTGTRWIIGAGVLLGLSISAKFIGFIILPLIVFAPSKLNLARLKFIQQRVLFIGVVFTTIALSYLPFISQGHLLDGFGSYAKSWKNNEGYFRLFERSAALTMINPEIRRQNMGSEKDKKDPILKFPQYDQLAMKYGFTKSWKGKIIPNTSFRRSQITSTLAKGIGALAMGCFLLLLLLLRRNVLESSLLLILLLYVIAPTTMPWYIAWLVPMAALTNHKSAIFYSLLVLLGYASWVSSHNGGPWAIPDWVLVVEYLLLTGALIIFPNFEKRSPSLLNRDLRSDDSLLTSKY